MTKTIRLMAGEGSQFSRLGMISPNSLRIWGQSQPLRTAWSASTIQEIMTLSTAYGRSRRGNRITGATINSSLTKAKQKPLENGPHISISDMICSGADCATEKIWRQPYQCPIKRHPRRKIPLTRWHFGLSMKARWRWQGAGHAQGRILCHLIQGESLGRGWPGCSSRFAPAIPFRRTINGRFAGSS